MAFDDQTEDDQTEDALAPEVIPDKDELRKKLYGNLSARLNGSASDDLAYSQKDIGDTNRRNALLAALTKSANQIGNVRGQVADSSPVSDMAKSVEGEGAQELQTEQQDQGRKDTLDRYLLGQIQRSDSVDARIKSQASIRAKALEAAAKAAKEKQDFQASENEKSRLAKADSDIKHAELLGAMRGQTQGGATDRADAHMAFTDFQGLQKDLDDQTATSRNGIGAANNKVNGAKRVMESPVSITTRSQGPKPTLKRRQLLRRSWTA
jgi:hypothetical protein